MRRFISAFSLAVLCLFCTACGDSRQIFKPYYCDYNFIRRADVDGVFGPWSITNRRQYFGEDW